jgi:hypothetical protein
VKRERAQTTSLKFSENHGALVLWVHNHDEERKASERACANARVERDGARFCLEGVVRRPCGTAECVFLSEEHGAVVLWDQEHQEKGKEITTALELAQEGRSNSKKKTDGTHGKNRLATETARKLEDVLSSGKLLDAQDATRALLSRSLVSEIRRLSPGVFKYRERDTSG